MPWQQFHCKDRHESRGFSLIELMATITVLGILIAIALPGIHRSMDSEGSKQDAENLGGRLRLARAQALSSYSDVIVYFNMEGPGTYTVHADNGGGVGIPEDPAFDPTHKNNGEIDPGEQVSTALKLESRSVFGFVPGASTSNGDLVGSAISFAGSPPRLTFHANGSASEEGWIGVIPLEDFLEHSAGRDYLVEVSPATGEVRASRAGH